MKLVLGSWDIYFKKMLNISGYGELSSKRLVNEAFEDKLSKTVFPV